jgi:hypothetical protein
MQLFINVFCHETSYFVMKHRLLNINENYNMTTKIEEDKTTPSKLVSKPMLLASHSTFQLPFCYMGI